MYLCEFSPSQLHIDGDGGERVTGSHAFAAGSQSQGVRGTNLARARWAKPQSGRML
jgi:hypothetical protein